MDFFKFHPHTRILFRDKKIPKSFMEMLLAMLHTEPQLRIQNVESLLEYDFI